MLTNSTCLAANFVSHLHNSGGDQNHGNVATHLSRLILDMIGWLCHYSMEKKLYLGLLTNYKIHC